MAKDFNVEPWFDDFDSTKNYHRILYKPGYAVQARELTQSQTILQDQISKFGLGIYADGSNVSGGSIFVDANITTVKIASNNNIDSFIQAFETAASAYAVAKDQLNAQKGKFLQMKSDPLVPASELSSAQNDYQTALTNWMSAADVKNAARDKMNDAAASAGLAAQQKANDAAMKFLA